MVMVNKMWWEGEIIFQCFCIEKVLHSPEKLCICSQSFCEGNNIRWEEKLYLLLLANAKFLREHNNFAREWKCFASKCKCFLGKHVTYREHENIFPLISLFFFLIPCPLRGWSLQQSPTCHIFQSLKSIIRVSKVHFFKSVWTFY